MRSFNQVALSVIHTNIEQGLFDLRCFNKLGNCALTHDMADVIDHFNHRAVNRVVQHILYETSIDLQEVYR